MSTVFLVLRASAVALRGHVRKSGGEPDGPTETESLVAVAFMGDPGQGKSTMAAALHR